MEPTTCRSLIVLPLGRWRSRTLSDNYSRKTQGVHRQSTVVGVQSLMAPGDRHDLELSNPVQMVEGTLIVLRSDRDEVTLCAYRRFTATSRPRDERVAQSAAWPEARDHEVRMMM